MFEMTKMASIGARYPDLPQPSSKLTIWSLLSGTQTTTSSHQAKGHALLWSNARLQNMTDPRSQCVYCCCLVQAAYVPQITLRYHKKIISRRIRNSTIGNTVHHDHQKIAETNYQKHQSLEVLSLASRIVRVQNSQYCIS